MKVCWWRSLRILKLQLWSSSWSFLINLLLIVDVIPNLFPRLDTVKLSALNKVVDMAEVKASLFSIGGLKALGVDGFPTCFYQNQWGQCAYDIFGMVVQVFTDCRVSNKLNSTLITLVPKVESPQSMVQFRPTILYSTLYKVISKLIVPKLRPILPKLIIPSQVALFLGGTSLIIFFLLKSLCINTRLLRVINVLLLGRLTCLKLMIT